MVAAGAGRAVAILRATRRSCWRPVGLDSASAGWGRTGAHGAETTRDGSPSAIPAIAILLLVGLALRLIIAYVLFPGSGFESDIGSFTSWALTLAHDGPGGFYANAGFADYPPGYLYVLWVLGSIGSGLAELLGGGTITLGGIACRCRTRSSAA